MCLPLFSLSLKPDVWCIVLADPGPCNRVSWDHHPEDVPEGTYMLEPCISPVLTFHRTHQGEIYNEFGPHYQGAQLSSFIPADFNMGATVATVVSDPGSSQSTGLIHTASNNPHISTSGSINIPIGPRLGLGDGDRPQSSSRSRSKQRKGLVHWQVEAGVWPQSQEIRSGNRLRLGPVSHLR